MTLIRFPPHLRNQFSIPAECNVVGATVAEALADLERQNPGVRHYLLDDQGALRQHVNIFIGDRWITDRRTLSDAVNESDEVFVMQVLSGG